MEARFVEFNEALGALAQRLREGTLSVAEFRSQRRQLLAALITQQASVSKAGPPSVVPTIEKANEKAKPRRGIAVPAVLLLIFLLALVLFGTLA